MTSVATEEPIGLKCLVLIRNVQSTSDFRSELGYG